MTAPVTAALIICLSGAAAAGGARAEANSGTAEDYLLSERTVVHAGASNHVRIYGRKKDEGAWVTILPSLGRGVEDYTEAFDSTLTTRLAEGGYRVVLIQPRGIGKSRGDLTPAKATMEMFAGDIRSALDGLAIRQINLIGHAFGNRLARTFATLHPERVDRLILMAAGGNFEMSEEQKNCLGGSFDLALPDGVRLEKIRCAFFAKGNDPHVWLDGWYPTLAAAQIHAARTIDGEFFKRAGGRPFLLIQAEQDFIAPPEKAGRALKAELGDQVTYVEIPDTGHALAPERPDAVAEHILHYLGGAAGIP